MQSTDKRRVLLLNNVPAPYFDPLFEQVGRESGWELTVCYSSTWNAGVGWAAKAIAGSPAHETVVLDRMHPWLTRRLGSFPSAAIALLRVLLSRRPDYLICYGYTLAPQMVALLYAIITRTPYALAGDSNFFSDRRRRGKAEWLRWVVRRSAAVISVGTANRMFWESYGARPEQIFKAGFAVNNAFFAAETDKQRPAAADWRARRGWADRVLFLYVGRLIKRKNIDLIIEAFRQIDEGRAALVIAGTGPEREALQERAQGHPDIHFAGAVDPVTLPFYYAVADALVLVAEQEPWGLVVNEAMASGLALIAHRHCGAAMDLVRPENGILIETLTSAEIAGAMQALIDDRDALHAMKLNSSEKIKNWSIGAAAYGMIRAVETSAAPDTRYPIPRV